MPQFYKSRGLVLRPSDSGKSCWRGNGAVVTVLGCLASHRLWNALPCGTFRREDARSLPALAHMGAPSLTWLLNAWL